jgi:hypothetical protein
MSLPEKITSATLALLEYIENEQYKGFDPYDALKSPLFKLPVFRSNKLLRFAFQQIVKRSPINLRSILRVPKGLNPVTLGLCIQSYASLARTFPERKAHYREKVTDLIDHLATLIPESYAGACWGYDFDWEARYSRIPAFEPTVVATGIISNALFKACETFEMDQAKALCLSAAEFVLNDLNRTGTEEAFCFSYSPFDNQVVYNASLKGARILAQAYSLNLDESLKQQAQSAVKFALQNQNSDGSWFYSQSRTGNWIDNYHTGYVLDCLDDYRRLTADERILPSIERGYTFYRDHFFDNDQIPKFYHNRCYPVDSTAAAQSLLTLSRFHDLSTAQQVAKWLITEMQNPDGYFFYRQYRNKTLKQSYMRWSNAWILTGLTTLLEASSSIQ